MSDDIGDFAQLFADGDFSNALSELNDAVSAPGDMIEGNIFYENLETLKDVPVRQVLAHYRRGYPAPLKGASGS